MIKILFVCHGNICRSPMAEYIMKDMVVKSGYSLADNHENTEYLLSDHNGKTDHLLNRQPVKNGYQVADFSEKPGEVFYIESAATSSEELGNPVYPPARKILANHGISCSGKTARRMTAEDYQKFDLLIGMDFANIRNMTRICGGDPDGKIKLLLDYAGKHREVADPWYTRDFQATWDDITEGCKALLGDLI